MKSFFSFVVVVFSFALGAQTHPLSRMDLYRIEFLRHRSDSALVRRALDEEKAFREASYWEINWFLVQIANHMEQVTHSFKDLTPYSELKDRVLQRMRRDLSTMQELNTRFAQLSPVKDEITWSCQANKLVDIISAAIDFYQEDGEWLMRGALPMDLNWEHARCLGPCEPCVGPCRQGAEGHNLVDLAFKASLLFTWLELNNQAHLQESSIRSMEDSPIVHSTPLPKNSLLEGIQNLSFFYNGTLSPNQGELAFVHGGYAFGGQNDDSRYAHLGPYGKRFGPQDCSSWMSKMLQLPEVMSTVDFAAAYRDFVKVEGECASQLQRFEPVLVDSIADLRPGMFLVTRRYDLDQDPDMTQTLGTSGHALLIIDVELESQTMLTLEYARNLPYIEGFGVRRIAFAGPNNVKSMYFIAN